MNKVFQISKEKFSALKKAIESLGNFEPRNIKNALWCIKVEDKVFTLYKSGKLLVQGKNLDSVENIIKGFIEEDKLDKSYDWYIGIDESGKGDTFGGMVICGVLVRGDAEKILGKFDIRDSKRMSDKEIEKNLSLLLPYLKRKSIEFKCVNLNPWEYNKLIKKYGDVNLLLISSYRKVATDLVKNVRGKGVIIADQFTNPERIRKAFEDVIKGADIIVETNAERYKVVALASMLARYKFIRQIEKISEETGRKMSLGSSASEIGDIIRSLSSEGFDISKVAKMHFKNVRSIIEK